MRQPGGEISSHDYERKRFVTDGVTLDAVVFYLREGEPVKIELERVLKSVGLWERPTEREPARQHRIVFEVASAAPGGVTEVYMSRFTVRFNAESGDAEP